jgi:Fe-S oxidoreductase
MIDTARAKARGVAEAIDPYLDEGYDVVVIEPSDLAMFREDYGRLLSEEKADRIAEHSYEILEYIYGLVANGADVDRLDTPAGTETAAYHSHCQQRTMGIEPYSIEVLESCGYEVTTSDVECCGMAGSFGYKQQYYELAMDVGEQLAGQLRAADADHVVASGTSCIDQIGDLLGDEPQHVVELIAPAPEE